MANSGAFEKHLVFGRFEFFTGQLPPDMPGLPKGLPPNFPGLPGLGGKFPGLPGGLPPGLGKKK